MLKRLMLAGAAALATVASAAPATSFAQYDLYNIIYIDGGQEVGFSRGVCGYSRIEHVPVWGQQTGIQQREYVGICIDGVPLYW